jgi:hypothetical protein
MLVYAKVMAMLMCHQAEKTGLLKRVAEVRRRLRTATRCLARFREYLRYLDNRPTRRMRGEDAARVVQFHALDYTRKWETAIAQSETTLGEAEAFATPLTHYRTRAVQELHGFSRSVGLASQQVEQLAAEVTGDLRLIRRHVSLAHRLLSALSLLPLTWRS